MAFSSVQSRFVIDGAPSLSNPLGTIFYQQTLAALTAIYEGSKAARDDIDNWLENHSTDIHINFAPNVAEADLGAVGIVRIDPSYFLSAVYVSKTGVVVQDSYISGLAHELSHAVTGFSDIASFSNLAGPNVKNVNEWYRQLGIAEQSTYNAYERPPANVSLNTSYTDGHRINAAIIDHGYDNDLGIDTGVASWGGLGVSGSMLLIGSSRDNNYIGTAKQDWIYGNDGNDALDGDGGNDKIDGGDGSDTVAGGLGSDTLIGGFGDDRLYGGSASGQADTSKDIADYTGSSVSKMMVSWNSGDGTYTVATGSALGTDILHDIQVIKSDAAMLTLKANGSITALDSVDVQYANADGVFFGNFSGMDGVKVAIGVDRTGSALDSLTSGGFGLEGVGTNIIAGKGDDSLTDLSDDDKMIDGGAGNDIITVGDGDAVIFGGEGADSITGGAGNDIIIDRSSVPLDQSYLAMHYDQYISGRISGGAGNDTIVVSAADQPLVYEELEEHEESTLNADALTHRDSYRFDIDPGQGNDTVTLDFYNYSVIYHYEAGDGHDIVYVKSSSNAAYSGDFLSDDSLQKGWVSQASLAVSFSGYDYGDWTATFTYYSAEIIAEDLPNLDFGPDWLLHGDLLVSFVDGGSITFKDVFLATGGNDPGHYYTPPDELQPLGGIDFGATLPFDLADAGISIVAGGSSARFGSGGSLLSSEGGGEVILSTGDHLYEGSSGETDRLIVAWDLDTLNVAFDDGTLTISDKWGALGTTTATDFDEVYVVSEDVTYTPEDFAAAIALRAESGEIFGTSGADTLTGTAARDRIFGLDGNDTLIGLTGDDTLNGGSGTDTMEGGAGNDTYIVDDEDDIVTEASNGGDDLVKSAINITLTSNVERLELKGPATDGTGNALDNRLTGNELANTLDGAGGNDVLDGLAGDDNLSGAEGDDRLLGGAGEDTLTGGDGADLLIGGTGADQTAGGAGDDAYYVDDEGDAVTEATGEGNDTIYSTAGTFTATANVERLVLVGDAYEGVASDEGMEIVGNGGDNFIDGGAGDDTLLAGNGNDGLYGGGGDDLLDGGDGDDTVYYDGAWADYTVTRISETEVTIASNAGVSDGSDKLISVEHIYFAADDIYIEPLEGWSIYQTGTSADDYIEGFANQTNALSGLDGNDILVAAGNDELDGGAGDDTLYVSSEAYSTELYGGEGSDTAVIDGSSSDYALYYYPYSTNQDPVAETAYPLPVKEIILHEMEQVYFTADDVAVSINDIPPVGTAGEDTINGSNRPDYLYGMEGNDVIVGNGGRDMLIGGEGTDTMSGGLGDDQYGVDNAGDVVIETIDGGYDHIGSDVSFTLPDYVESLAVSGGDDPLVDAYAIGNSLDNSIQGYFTGGTMLGLDGNDEIVSNGGDNTINGGDGDDVLSGGEGDTLIGGAGDDQFGIVSSPYVSTFATINDFDPDDDIISLIDYEGILGEGGALDGDIFTIGTAATASEQRLIYDSSTGDLFIDADGLGGEAQVQIAHLIGAPALDATSFEVIA